jgi:2-polyprenyl-6-methoxyphenol hydroxylase-like FAD-dependent oxidoreductase
MIDLNLVLINSRFPGRIMKDQSVLISGAGIAGTTLAYWLACYGFRPTLVERAPRLREGGYVIDFWGLGYDVAEKMGLLYDLKRRAYRVEELRFVNDRGLRVGGFGVDVFRELTDGRYVTLPRSELGQAIYHMIESQSEILFDDSIASVENAHDGVIVKFKRAPSRLFDLAVGADGLHSAVRRIVFGPESQYETYLGYAVAAFEAEGYHPRDERIYVSYGLPGKQVSRFSLRDNRTLFLIVFLAPKQALVDLHDISAKKATLHREFDNAGWECAQILGALDRTKELYFDTVSQIRMNRWSRGRVALVGDAAFAPSLLAGQGSALAMTAAYVLAGELATAEGQYQHAFDRYERTLREFIDGKQKAAERFAGSFAPKTRFGLLMRNELSKAFRFPFLANLFIGRGLLDHLTLQPYPLPRCQFMRTKNTTPN